MTNRTILVIGLILIIAVGTNWIIEVAEQQPAQDEMARNDPDMYMVNAQVTQFGPNGTKQHELTADRMTHFPLTDVTTLKSPNLKLFSDSPDSPWDIVAVNGRLLPKSQLQDEKVELWNDVVAVKQEAGDFINIKTRSLTVFPRKDYAETDESVRITNNAGSTSAGRMKAYLQPGRFEFSSHNGQRVETILLPVDRQSEAG